MNSVKNRRFALVFLGGCTGEGKAGNPSAGGFFRTDHPSVEYRGIFINDEEELEAWVKKHMGEETIGVKTYEKVFELLLRLKANYIWPAMHVNSFNSKRENGALAERMGIVVGTSHCDMLMRSNNREWRPWIAKRDTRMRFTTIPYQEETGKSCRNTGGRAWSRIRILRSAIRWGCAASMIPALRRGGWKTKARRKNGRPRWSFWKLLSGISAVF